ncbi:MAG: hypothetical protein QOF48_1204 [Verrucomicrobiota bacterium]|jgi:dinuclear metal center YbgI/SA1388 family protein
MSRVSLSQVVRYCERTLRTSDVADYDGAHNGLQVENRGGIERIAAAVDASLATIRMAIDAKADLLIVHHGLFWGARHPWTGRNYELMRLMIENNLAVYSSHLPLDLHPRLGNNVQLAGALGLRNLKPFFFEKEQHLGVQASASVPLKELAKRLELVVRAEPVVLPGGPTICRRIGIVTGGAGAEVKRAAAEGVDTFITGEGPHWTFGLAQELRVNVLYGGHYATETFGVKALGAELSRKFGIPWEFLDHPSGL